MIIISQYEIQSNELERKWKQRKYIESKDKKKKQRKVIDYTKIDKFNELIIFTYIDSFGNHRWGRTIHQDKETIAVFKRKFMDYYNYTINNEQYKRKLETYKKPLNKAMIYFSYKGITFKIPIIAKEQRLITSDEIHGSFFQEMLEERDIEELKFIKFNS